MTRQIYTSLSIHVNGGGKVSGCIRHLIVIKYGKVNDSDIQFWAFDFQRHQGIMDIIYQGAIIIDELIDIIDNNFYALN